MMKNVIFTYPLYLNKSLCERNSCSRSFYVSVMDVFSLFHNQKKSESNFPYLRLAREISRFSEPAQWHLTSLSLACSSEFFQCFCSRLFTMYYVNESIWWLQYDNIWCRVLGFLKIIISWFILCLKSWDATLETKSHKGKRRQPCEEQIIIVIRRHLWWTVSEMERICSCDNEL